MLVLAANMKKEKLEGVSIRLASAVSEIIDAESQETIARNSNVIITDVESFGHKIFKIKK